MFLEHYPVVGRLRHAVLYCACQIGAASHFCRHCNGGTAYETYEAGDIAQRTIQPAIMPASRRTSSSVNQPSTAISVRFWTISTMVSSVRGSVSLTPRKYPFKPPW